MSRWRRTLSWLPLLALLLLLFTAWWFLLRSSVEGGQELLSAACPEEQTKQITRNSFEIIWREQGCQSVSASFVQRAGNWLEEWNDQKDSIFLDSLSAGTTIDIRQGGKSEALWSFGEPGAIVWPADSSPQGQYLLMRSLNELALREAFPRGKNLRLLAGALAAKISPAGTLRLVLPSRERLLAESLPEDWNEQFTDCQGQCLEKLFP